VIRPERPGDEDAIRSVQTAAFGRDDEAKIVDDLRAGNEYTPELSLVAEEQGVLVGHVMVSRAHVEPSGDRILLLGPIGVVSERQGEGIGSALVEAALAGARDLGATCVVLIGSPAYYERFSFLQAEPLGLLPPERWGHRAPSRSRCSTRKPRCRRGESSAARRSASEPRTRAPARARGGACCGAF
jgi:putative acetyltransferase